MVKNIYVCLSGEVRRGWMCGKNGKKGRGGGEEPSTVFVVMDLKK